MENTIQLPHNLILEFMPDQITKKTIVIFNAKECQPEIPEQERGQTGG